MRVLLVSFLFFMVGCNKIESKYKAGQCLTLAFDHGGYKIYYKVESLLEGHYNAQSKVNDKAWMPAKKIKFEVLNDEKTYKPIPCPDQ